MGRGFEPHPEHKYCDSLPETAGCFFMSVGKAHLYVIRKDEPAYRLFFNHMGESAFCPEHCVMGWAAFALVLGHKPF